VEKNNGVKSGKPGRVAELWIHRARWRSVQCIGPVVVLNAEG
jgi:hypothetical protein